MLGALSASAQTPPTGTTGGVVTRVLAIGHLTPEATREKIMPVMLDEVRDTVKLHLDGKIDQWFARRDVNGVVFLMNVTTAAEAKALLDKLPLGVNKLMDFDLIPLGPLTPLARLVAATQQPAK